MRPAARAVDIFVLAFSDPVQNTPQERSRIDAAQSFEFPSDNIQTLSTNTVNAGSQIEGLLFVPELPPNHPCLNTSNALIPKNVTRLHNLPSVEYQYIAFAPWISPECTQAYLAAVPGRLARAFLFYLSSTNSTDLPPEPSDPTWNLGDGGSWKKSNKFPVYAIPGPNGNIVMQQLAQYSGRISDMQNGDRLAQQLNPADYVRLYASFELNINSNLPTLWAFLLIVVAVVLLLVGTTSCAMHCVQRRRRRNLRQRVQRGEVDLAVLGLKAQQMTQADVDALPLTRYTPSKGKPNLPLPSESLNKPDPLAPPSTASAPSPSDYNQPHCPICLDEFIPSSTNVRVLPCNHIYHPDCIDHYLLTASTLCPICKNNSKPPRPAECPEITNAMVRRERHIRRLRDVQAGRLRSGGGVEGLGHWASFRRNYRNPLRGVPIVRPLPVLHRSTGSQVPTVTTNRGANNAGARGAPNVQNVEMGETAGGRQSNVMRQMEAVQPPDDVGERREWARNRAERMVRVRMLDDGRAVEVEDLRDDEGTERERPRCKFPFRRFVR